MMARANPLISILERGDPYRLLVELLGGRVMVAQTFASQKVCGFSHEEPRGTETLPGSAGVRPAQPSAP